MTALPLVHFVLHRFGLPSGNGHYPFLVDLSPIIPQRYPQTLSVGEIELLHEMMSVPGNAEQLEKELRDAAKGVRLVRDAIKPIIRILKATPAGEMPPGSLDNQLSTWRSWNLGALQFSEILKSAPMSAMNYRSEETIKKQLMSVLTLTTERRL
jgi:hypothetical protein